MEITLETTLVEARDHIQKLKESGEAGICLACGQTVKVYRRNLNGPMAQILCLIYKYFANPNHQEWLHVDEYLKKFQINCRYYSLLQHWGLIEGMPGERNDGSRRTGYWRITRKGKEFVEGITRVPVAFYMFNSDVETMLGVDGFDVEQVSIGDCLKSGGFDYQEIMKPF